MLDSAAVCQLVATEMAMRKPAWLIVDRGTIATRGSRLLDEDAIAVMLARLIPLADSVTPNLPEAEMLLGHSITTPRQCDDTSAPLLALGARAVLLKGGHGKAGDIVARC